MQPVRMLITARFVKSELDRLQPIRCEPKFAGWGVTRRKLGLEELRSYLPGVEIFILEFEPVTRELLQAAPELRLIGCCRGGPEANVDIEAATDMGVPVLYTPGRNAVSVAEYTLGLMISLARHIAKVHHLLRYTSELTEVSYEDKLLDRRNITSEWSLDANAPFNQFSGPELSGKVLGLVGCGAIGREVARRARALGMQLVVSDPNVPSATLETLGAQAVDLSELAKTSDFVVMAAKVTPETKGLFSADLIGLMKPTAYFINTARAALVDYDALFLALQAKRIRGAALDVYRTEPIAGADKRFLSLDNVVLSPHLAGASQDVFRHHSRMMVDDLALALNGTQPQHLANPEVWDRCRLALEANQT